MALGDRRTEALCLMNLGSSRYHQQNYHESLDLLEAALRIFKSIGDQYNEAIVLSDLGNTYAALNETAKAFGCYKRSLKKARAGGDTRTEGSCLFNFSLAVYAQGKTDEALIAAEQAWTLLQALEDRHAEAVRRQIETWRAEVDRSQ